MEKEIRYWLEADAYTEVSPGIQEVRITSARSSPGGETMIVSLDESLFADLRAAMDAIEAHRAKSAP